MGIFYKKLKQFPSLCLVASFLFTSLYVNAQEMTWKSELDSASKKNHSSAIVHLEKALKLGTENMKFEEKLSLLKRLAEAYFFANNLDNAIFYNLQTCDMLRESVKTKNNATRELDLAKMLTQTADWHLYNMNFSEARRGYEEALRTTKNEHQHEKIIIGLIFTNHFLGDVLKAQSFIKELIKMNANDPITKAFKAYAKIFELNPNIEEIIAEMEFVKRNNTENIQFLLIVANFYAKLRKSEQAIENYDRAIKIINESKNKEESEHFRYFKNFAFLEKANIYINQKDFVRAETQLNNLINNGVKSPFLVFAKIITQKERDWNIEKEYSFSNNEISQLIKAKNISKRTDATRDSAKIVAFGLEHCSGEFNPNDESNVGKYLLRISENLSATYHETSEHQLNLIKLYIKTKQMAKAEAKIKESLQKIKTAKSQKISSPIAKWNKTSFEQLEKELGIVDKVAPYITMLSPQFDQNTRGGGEKELSEETFDIKFEIVDNIGLGKIVANGNQVPLEKGAKKIIYLYKAKFYVEVGKTQSFTIDAFDLAGNRKSEKFDIRRKEKQEMTAHIAPKQEILKNKTLDPSLIGKQTLVLIGTDIYTHWSQLNNSVSDMETLKKTLQSKYRVDSVIVLYNRKKVEIMNALHSLANLKFQDQDQILIAIAGHGDFLRYDNRQDGRGFIVPSDASPKDLDMGRASYISYDDLKGTIDQIHCKHKLLILDVCFGGTIDERVATRGLPQIKLSDCEKANEFLKENNKKEFYAVITSGGKESVYDGKPGETSPFMKDFIKSLEQEGGIFGTLTADEVWDKISTDVIAHKSSLKTTPHFSYLKNIENKMLGTYLFFRK